MTDEQLQAIEARLAAATPRPWKQGTYSWWRAITSPSGHVAYANGTNPGADAPFIANAPADIAALIAEVRRLRMKDYTLDDVEQMMKNLGVDVTCGSCAEIAFTGATTHAHTCAERKNDNPATIFVTP